MTVRKANATDINVMALFAMVNYTFNIRSVNLTVFPSDKQNRLIKNVSSTEMSYSI